MCYLHTEKGSYTTLRIASVTCEFHKSIRSTCTAESQFAFYSSAKCRLAPFTMPSSGMASPHMLRSLPCVRQARSDLDSSK